MEDISLSIKIKHAVWNGLWKFGNRIKSIKCFLVGHHIWYGDWRLYEEDYCKRCYKTNPTNEKVVPAYLHSILVYGIENSKLVGDIFEASFDWKIKLPKWWEY